MSYGIPEKLNTQKTYLSDTETLTFEKRFSILCRAPTVRRVVLFAMPCPDRQGGGLYTALKHPP